MKSQTQRILSFLLKGRKITALEALKKFGCMRLASRCAELKHKTPYWNVQSEMVTLKNGKRIARYFIP